MVTLRRPNRWWVTVACLTAAAWSVATPSCLAEGWVDWKVYGPFVCRGEFSLDEWDGLLQELTQIERDLVAYLRVPPAQEPIEIYLFRSKKSYVRYLKRYLPNVPYRRALYVKTEGPGRVFTYRSRQLAIDLRHECTHALLHAALPMVPLWLDEGLAEYFEVPSAKRAFGNPHLESLRWNLRLGSVPRLGKLENKGAVADMNWADYRYAWGWVHFMLHGPVPARQELIQFLGDIHRRSPPGTLSQRLQQRLPGVERRFAAHFKSWKR